MTAVYFRLPGHVIYDHKRSHAHLKGVVLLLYQLLRRNDMKLFYDIQRKQTCCPIVQQNDVILHMLS